MPTARPQIPAPTLNTPSASPLYTVTIHLDGDDPQSLREVPSLDIEKFVQRIGTLGYTRVAGGRLIYWPPSRIFKITATKL